MTYVPEWEKITGAVIILIVGIILARIASNFIRRLMDEIELDKLVKKVGFVVPFGNYFYLGVRFLIYFGTLVLALRELGFSNKGLEMLFIIAFVLVIIFIILAFKDILPNLIAKFIFLGKYNLKKGDKIKVDNLEGTILEIGLLETKIKHNKEDVFIPNSILAKKIIKKN